MKGYNRWSYSPYKPFFFETGDIYINRIVPYPTGFHFEWSPLSEGRTEYSVYFRKRDSGQYKLAGITEKHYFDISNLVEEYEYEFYVEAAGKKSRIRLVRTGCAVGNVVNYLHPDDQAYSYSGRYLCSPSFVRHPEGYLLSSMDLYAHQHAQNLTLIYRSDDEGETWHYVSELCPCFWGKLFIHKGDVYMLAVSTDHGDLLLGRSVDGGKTFDTPAVLLRGSAFGKWGVHKTPMNVVYYNGRIYETLEWGIGQNDRHAVMVMSCDEDADLLSAENWHFSEPLAYDQEWEGLPKGPTIGNIEGTLVVFPDGKLYSVMRYDMSRLHPDRGLALVYRVNTEDPDAPLEYIRPMEFSANNSKFEIKKDNQAGKYYSVATRITPERAAWCRNLLSLMRSEDMVHWDVVCDLYDFRDKDPMYTAMQYVNFEIEGDDILFLSRTSINGACDWHNGNYITFHRVKNFREL